MVTTAGDLLNLPVMRRARPEVLTGDVSVPVRWVHTSEIFEIGALLEGGELLLTTGLGLVREPPHRLAAYMAELAARRVAGIVLELGRPFAAAPDAMLEAARESGMLLVVLHEVVPWVQVTEAAHRLLLASEVSGLRRINITTRNLLAEVARGSDLAGVLDVVAREIGHPVGFVGRDELEVWSTGSGRPGDEPFDVRDVRVANGSIGEIWIPQAAGAESELLDALVSALAAVLDSSASGEGRRPARVRSKLQEVVAAAPRLDSLHRRILAEAGLDPSVRRQTQAFLAIVGDGTASELLVENLAHRFFASAMAVETALGIVLLARDRVRSSARGDDVVARLANDLRKEIPGSILVEGEPQATLADLGRELHDLQVLASSHQVRRSGRVVLTSRDTTLVRLVAQLEDASEVERFVVRELGPVLEHDARNRPPLMPTLLALLGSDSKVAAADRLGVTRQTLHHRSQLLDGMLGLGPSAPLPRRAAVTLAALLWQWRTTNAL